MANLLFCVLVLCVVVLCDVFLFVVIVVCTSTDDGVGSFCSDQFVSNNYWLAQT